MVQNKSDHPYEGYLERAIKHHSFVDKTEEEKEDILNTFYKFTILRNPAVRLVSAYLSKIRAQPMLGLETSVPERNWLKINIYQTLHPELFHAWTADGAKAPIYIEFRDFVKFFILTGGIKRDEHFQTFFELCSPCQVKYSYYGNFNRYMKEVAVFNERIQGNWSHLLYKEFRKEGGTYDLAKRYYSLLSHHEKTEVVKILAVDLLFYYALFPEEKDSHKDIMGIDYDIPQMKSV